MTWTLLFILGSSLTGFTFSWTYHHMSNTMNWTQARHQCQARFTDLVVIQSQEENDYLVSVLPNRTSSPYYWIGITKTHTKEPWRWVGNNSTWIGERSWAANEPNNNHTTEFCVEIYVNHGKNRGKWNDEKCSNKKYPVCYRAQCNESVCDRGRCRETIGGTACVCEPGFMGHRCQTENDTRGTNDSVSCTSEPGVKADGGQTAPECPRLPPPENGSLRCSGGNHTFNSSCRYACVGGFLLIGPSTVTCGSTGSWSGPRPTCASYKHALMAVAACGAFAVLSCICFCLMKHKRRKKLAQVRQYDEDTSPAHEVHE
ncbi:E-selectin-like [Betta splendens]|uniref:E-selectin-like n=1 Tax=Betta splendens TaxID=158456 RepID=A0A9W2XRZ8_BETSP|nr:E-selectin-like [Betta splendens]